MSSERTLGIVKPDAVGRKLQGKIIDRVLSEGFEIVTMKQTDLTRDQAERFYAEHKERPFFNSLVEFMISGPIVAMILEKEGGIKGWRDLMGATNPKDAAEGTIRKEMAVDLEKNSVHGSDSSDAARREITFFFSRIE